MYREIKERGDRLDSYESRNTLENRPNSYGIEATPNPYMPCKSSDVIKDTGQGRFS